MDGRQWHFSATLHQGRGPEIQVMFSQTAVHIHRHTIQYGKPCTLLISYQLALSGQLAGLQHRTEPNLHSALKTSSSIDSAMDRIGADETAVLLKFDADHMKIVNVFQITADSLNSEVGVPLADDEVTRATLANMMGNLATQCELVVRPFGMYLRWRMRMKPAPFANALTFRSLMYKPSVRQFSIKAQASASCKKETVAVLSLPRRKISRTGPPRITAATSPCVTPSGTLRSRTDLCAERSNHSLISGLLLSWKYPGPFRLIEPPG